MFPIPSSTVLNLIGDTFHAASVDETRAHLGGLCFQSVEGKLRSIGLDGNRLAFFDSQVDAPTSDRMKEGLIIPRKGVFELKRFAESFPDTSLFFSYSEADLYVFLENAQLMIRLMAKTYPPYQNIIPQRSDKMTTITLERDPVLEAVRRVRVMSSEKVNSVVFSFEDRLTVSTRHEIFGRAQEELPCHYPHQGTPLKITFNCRFISDILSVLPEGEFRMHVINPTSPVLFSSPSLEGFLSVIMPLNL